MQTLMFYLLYYVFLSPLSRFALHSFGGCRHILSSVTYATFHLAELFDNFILHLKQILGTNAANNQIINMFFPAPWKLEIIIWFFLFWSCHYSDRVDYVCIWRKVAQTTTVQWVKPHIHITGAHMGDGHHSPRSKSRKKLHFIRDSCGPRMCILESIS